MNIVIVDATAYSKTRFADFIDHTAHRVLYIGDEEYLATVPSGFERIPLESVKANCRMIESILGDRVDLILTTNERTQMIAAEMRHALNITIGLRPESQILTIDKIAMKNAVANAGLRVPQFYLLKEIFSEVTFRKKGRYVLKPRAGVCAVGVHIFEDFQALFRHAKTLTSQEIESLQFEEFIEGELHHLDGLMAEGRIVSSLLSKYLGNCFDTTNLGKPVGSLLVDDVNKTIERWAEQCLTALKVKNGAFHLEFFLTSEGPVFLECGSRMGGALVCEYFRLKTGLHIPEEQFKIDSGKPIGSVTVANEYFGFVIFPPDEKWRLFNSLPQSLLDNPSLVLLHHSSNPSRSKGTFAEGKVPLAALFKGRTSAEVESHLTMAIDLVEGMLIRQNIA